MISVNGENINVTIFPDKTSQVWQVPIIDQTPKRFDIEWVFEHEGELFHLAQLVRLIRHNRVPVPITLHMPYLPYGRQDKEISNESTFALRVFGNMIENMGFDKITTLDAHSDLLDKMMPVEFESIFPEKEIDFAIGQIKATALAFPDGGAWTRYGNLLFDRSMKGIIGHKVRDPKTGYITKYHINGDPKDHDILIIDDIADGGMTFILLTKDLLQAGAKSVNLYATHGIFSKGIEVLKDAGISRIFTHKGEQL